jgi:hypothetical protein
MRMFVNASCPEEEKRCEIHDESKLIVHCIENYLQEDRSQDTILLSGEELFHKRATIDIVCC